MLDRSKEQPVADDRYARESFTFRRMGRWQVWSISAISAAVLVAIALAWWA